MSKKDNVALSDVEVGGVSLLRKQFDRRLPDFLENPAVQELIALRAQTSSVEEATEWVTDMYLGND